MRLHAREREREGKRERASERGGVNKILGFFCASCEGDKDFRPWAQQIGMCMRAREKTEKLKDRKTTREKDRERERERERERVDEILDFVYASCDLDKDLGPSAEQADRHIAIWGGFRWLRLVGSLKLYFSFAKEPYERDDILQKRPIILRSLLIVATPYIYHVIQMVIHIYYV